MLGVFDLVLILAGLLLDRRIFLSVLRLIKDIDFGSAVVLSLLILNNATLCPQDLSSLIYRCIVSFLTLSKTSFGL